MDAFVIKGPTKLQGVVSVSGAKNVALKVLVAACLTSEAVTISNVPKIADVATMIDIMKELGGEASFEDHTITIRAQKFKTHILSLENGAKARTSVMFMVPLLYRLGKAVIPNPGGCRLGARPVDRIIDGLTHMNAAIEYRSNDGYFHARTKGLKGTTYTFKKNTHTGTETLLLAGVIAEGTTILKNAAEEPEIDDLIGLLNAMGGNIRRSGKREITIIGVKNLHGAKFEISSDRNEIVTLGIGAILTGGDIIVKGAKKEGIEEFLEKLAEVNGGYELGTEGIHFFYKGRLKPANIVTSIYPGFMTDWQAPWAVLMTKANGISFIHETVFENKLGYIHELRKMGAKIIPFKPHVRNPEAFYNFNMEDDSPEYIHAVKVYGPTPLHNAIVNSIDIRAGATVVLAAMAAKGESTIFGVEKLDRGYEHFEDRLNALGAQIKRVRKELPL